MEAAEFRGCIETLRWSQRGVAEILGCDDRLVRRWAVGDASVPPAVAEWLVELAELHSTLPPPLAWRRRGNPQREGERTAMSDDSQSSDRATVAPTTGGASTTELRDISWDWQPGGRFLARGTLAVSRDGRGAQLRFEVPLDAPPPMAALRDPESWIVNLLRRTMRR